MKKEKVFSLTKEEKEIVALKIALDMINEMVNYEMLNFKGNPPDEIGIKTSSHQKLFLILLVDFLSNTTSILEERNIISHLINICANPILGGDANVLNNAVQQFNEWINKKIVFNEVYIADYHNIRLKISRLDLLLICGNIMKHNIANLTYKIDKLRTILNKQNIVTSNDYIITVLYELRDKFISDNLDIQIPILAELLNNIRIGILQYLTPLYNQTIKYNEANKEKYSYTYLENINSVIGKEFFWNLMNDVRHNFYARGLKNSEIIWKINYKTEEFTRLPAF